MSRPSPINLRRHDFEDAADYISRAVKMSGAATAVAGPDGCLRLLRTLPDADLLDLTRSPAYIGTFNQNTRIEFIEDEILEWQRAHSLALVA